IEAFLRQNVDIDARAATDGQKLRRVCETAEDPAEVGYKIVLDCVPVAFFLVCIQLGVRVVIKATAHDQVGHSVIKTKGRRAVAAMDLGIPPLQIAPAVRTDDTN